jgi:hypothetical protein
MLQLDHIAIAANSLAEGVAYAERILGVPIPPGGAHPLMGTHNHLLQLGGECYLEVIAIDPDAPQPERPRWFALDDNSMRADLEHSPRLVTWIARVASLDHALHVFPDAARPALAVSRGSLSWRIGVREDGSLPYDGAFPTLIEWPGNKPPTDRMADHGCRLETLTIRHPGAERLSTLLRPSLDDPRICFEHDANRALAAVIRTPTGLVTLS